MVGPVVPGRQRPRRVTAAVAGLSLRPATPDDEPFLRRVYESTRAYELAVLGWDDATRSAFIDQQHSAQAADYRRRHPDARFLVVEVDAAPVGRLYLAESESTVYVLDISLLPDHRGRGVGQALLEQVVAEGKAVSLSVLRWNPAQRLYLRLGFAVVAEDDVYLRMERPAQLNTDS